MISVVYQVVRRFLHDVVRRGGEQTNRGGSRRKSVVHGLAIARGSRTNIEGAYEKNDALVLSYKLSEGRARRN